MTGATVKYLPTPRVVIAGVPIGPGYPCRFVAELSNAHNGSLELALEILEDMKRAGVDLVKFQAYTPEELVALRGDGPAPEAWGKAGWTMAALYEKAQTPLAWFPRLVQACRDLGLPWFASVFGLESLAAMEKLGCSAYKIARLDNAHEGHLLAVLSRQKPVLMSDSREVRIDLGRSRIPERYAQQLHFLYCPPGYPQNPTAYGLPFFNGKGCDQSFHWLGLSSHLPDCRLGPAAVARGAAVLEYHVRAARVPSALEEAFSLRPSDVRALLDDVRMTEQLIRREYEA